MRARGWQGVLIVVLLLTAVWLISVISGLAGKAKVAVGQAHDVERQYLALEERKAMLEANLAALGSARGKDAAIRSSFGVARPGEEVIVVVPPAPVVATTTESWWDRLWSWF